MSSHSWRDLCVEVTELLLYLTFLRIHLLYRYFQMLCRMADFEDHLDFGS